MLGLGQFLPAAYELTSATTPAGVNQWDGLSEAVAALYTGHGR